MHNIAKYMLMAWRLGSFGFFSRYMKNLKARSPEVFILSKEKSIETILCELGILACALTAGIVGMLFGMSWIVGAILLYLYECYEFSILKIEKKRKYRLIGLYIIVPVLLIVTILMTGGKII